MLRALTDLKLAPTERLQSLDRQVSEGLTRLYDYQHDDGGWGWWKTDQNHPFMTAYALYGLLQARDHGYKVDPSRIFRGRDALQMLYRKYPRAVPDLKAYLVYVLVLAREKPEGNAGAAPVVPPDLVEALDAVWSARSRMTPYGQALLLLTLDRDEGCARRRAARGISRPPCRRAAISRGGAPRTIRCSTTSPTRASRPPRSRSTRSPAATRRTRRSRRSSAGCCSTATRARTGAARSRPRWCCTGCSTTCARAASRRRRSRWTSSSTAPKAGTHSFDAAAIASPDPFVMSAPAAIGANAVRIVKQGAGALYWSAVGQYYDKPAAAARTGSRTLAITRGYFSLAPVTKGGRIVYRETPFGGTAQPGDLILVRLTAAGSIDWRYLMIEDPLPAGAEPVEQDDLYRAGAPAGAVVWKPARVPRRSRGVLPGAVRSRPLRVPVPAQGGDARRLPRDAGADRADVRARRLGVERRADGHRDGDRRIGAARRSAVTRIAGATLWLIIGHAVVGGLFWLLLNVPESNVATLATSALIVVLLIAVAALVEGAAVVWLEGRAGARGLATRAPSALVAFIAAACAFWAIWWITGRATRWLAIHGGEMDAWLLLHFNITKTARLHAGLAWAVTIARYVLGLSIAAALVGAGTIEGVASLAASGVWARRAFAPRRLVAIAFCWALLLWLPWMAAGWRPRTLPRSAELVFVSVKLAVLYLAANLGVALILRVQLPRPLFHLRPLLPRGNLPLETRAGARVRVAQRARRGRPLQLRVVRARHAARVDRPRHRDAPPGTCRSPAK